MRLSSTFKGIPKEAETESTTVSIPYSLRIGHMADTSLKIPLGVSQCTSVAYLKLWSVSRNSLRLLGSMGLPVSYTHLDVYKRQNKGIVAAIEEKLGAKLFISEDAQLCGAIVAALIGLESLTDE